MAKACLLRWNVEGVVEADARLLDFSIEVLVPVRDRIERIPILRDIALVVVTGRVSVAAKVIPVSVSEPKIAKLAIIRVRLYVFIV